MADRQQQQQAARNVQQEAQEFTEYMTRLFTALDIQEGSIRRLEELLLQFGPTEQIRIIQNTAQFVDELFFVDRDLKNFYDNLGKDYHIKDNWDKMTESLGELQMLSLLEKVEGTCDEVINALLDALSKKITKVNEILRSKLHQPAAGRREARGGNINDKYLNKYLKYKNKYVYLKRNY